MINNTNPSPLRIARVSAGVRQADLAASIARSTMFISRLERGGCAVLTPEIAARIAETVNVPAVLLFAGGKR